MLRFMLKHDVMCSVFCARTVTSRSFPHDMAMACGAAKEAAADGASAGMPTEASPVPGAAYIDPVEVEWWPWWPWWPDGMNAP